MRNLWLSVLLVGLGGGVGSLARYGLAIFMERWAWPWPFGTMAANLLGCFLTGIIAALYVRGETISPELRLALATGFCGGFTTLSSLVFETMVMWRAGDHWHATLYSLGTLVLSFVSFVLGWLAVRIVFRNAGSFLN